MIRIKPELIYALRDSTGRTFTELMDRLIRHAIEEEIKRRRALLDADPAYSSRLQTMDVAALF
jgi:hypothetical protein